MILVEEREAQTEIQGQCLRRVEQTKGLVQIGLLLGNIFKVLHASLETEAPYGL